MWNWWRFRWIRAYFLLQKSLKVGNTAWGSTRLIYRQRFTVYQQRKRMFYPERHTIAGCPRPFLKWCYSENVHFWLHITLQLVKRILALKTTELWIIFPPKHALCHPVVIERNQQLCQLMMIFGQKRNGHAIDENWVKAEIFDKWWRIKLRDWAFI